MQTRRIFLGALAAPLLLLPACGGHDTSVADPPVAPSTSSAPADPPKRESPEHFVRRWFDIGTAMQNSGKTGKYRSLQDGCQDCAAVASRVEKTYSAGGYFETEGVRTLHVLSDKKKSRVRIVDVRVDLAPTTYVKNAGGTKRRFTGGPAHFQLNLEPSEGSWLVTSFVQVSA